MQLTMRQLVAIIDARVQSALEELEDEVPPEWYDPDDPRTTIPLGHG